MAKITVLGSGGWGIALALCAHNSGHEVYLWSAFKDEISKLKRDRQNDKLLPGVVIDDGIVLSDDISVAENSDLTIIAVPSVAVKSVTDRLSAVNNHGIVVNVAKGFEPETGRRLSEVISAVLPDDCIVVLSGPSHAEEVARKIPTSLVASSKSLVGAAIVQEFLSSE